jgi:Cytochrome c554 and c-prime
MKRAFAIMMAVVLCLLPRMLAKGHSAAQTAGHPSAVSPEVPHNARGGYVGDDACRSCHQSQFDSYRHTAHHVTSTAPSRNSILGKFTAGDNLLKTANPNLFFQMEEKQVDGKEDSFFQTAVAGQPPHINSRSERIAVVVGSGEKGQTYLYWNEDQLFQLPVSYWTRLGWVNSPGYRDGFANFDRPIIPRCVECHATYFEAFPPPMNKYSTTGFTLGISCEKCHGPGREHIEREKSKSPPPAATAVLNPTHFSRDRQMDLCAWCHAGHGRPLRPSFSYLPGQPLADYIDLPPPDPDAPLDVHGNQVELLKQSRCYRSSNMTCLTCHDVHTAQHDLTQFSQRCLSCHKPGSATFARADHPVTGNCIGCHMPKQATNLIVFDWKGTKVRPEMRNHWIKVYPGLTAAAGDHAPAPDAQE